MDIIKAILVIARADAKDWDVTLLGGVGVGLAWRIYTNNRKKVEVRDYFGRLVIHTDTDRHSYGGLRAKLIGLLLARLARKCVKKKEHAVALEPITIVFTEKEEEK